MKASRFRKPFVLAAVATAPFLFPITAAANTAASSPLVNQEAVSLLTTSVKRAVTAHDKLLRGDTALAKKTLDEAVSKLSTAVRYDSTLGLSYGADSSNPLMANSFKSDLQAVQATLRSGNAQAARTELERVLSQAGVV